MARSRQVATRDWLMRSGVRIFWPSEPNEAGGSTYCKPSAASVLYRLETCFHTTSRLLDW